MTAAKGAIARRMDAVLGGLEEEFRLLYDVSDFEQRLCVLNKSG